MLVLVVLEEHMLVDSLCVSLLRLRPPSVVSLTMLMTTGWFPCCLRGREIRVAAEAALAAGKEIRLAVEKDDKDVQYKGTIDL